MFQVRVLELHAVLSALTVNGDDELDDASRRRLAVTLVASAGTPLTVNMR